MITEQLIGNLPAEQVTIESLFSKCGLDFCGSFLVRLKSNLVSQRKGALHKMYIGVFVRFATCVVHLEIVSDLSILRH